jgi:hypothetical protein
MVAAVTRHLAGIVPPPPDGTVESHAFCLVCGDRNPLSLKLRFAPEGDDGVLGPSPATTCRRATAAWCMAASSPRSSTRPAIRPRCTV